MKTEKIINDIKQWFKKNEPYLENELLTYWEDGYIINGHDISIELTPYSFIVYPSEDAPNFADNRWEIGCDIYLYNETGNYRCDNIIVGSYSKNGLVDAIIEAIKKLDLK